MKRSVLMTALGWLAFGLSAQDAPQGYEYVPLVREGIVWEHHVSRNYAEDGESKTEKYTYLLQFEGEVEENGVVYKACYRSDPDGGNRRLAGLAREEGGKVYGKMVYLEPEVREIFPMEETLLYDFSATAVGDLTEWWGGIGQRKVEKIDWWQNGDVALRRLYIDGLQQWPVIEGVGMVWDDGRMGDPLFAPFAVRHNDMFGATTQLMGVRDATTGKYLWKGTYPFGGVDVPETDLAFTMGDGMISIADSRCRRAVLCSVSGLVVATVSGSDGGMEIETCDLPAGVYILVMDTEDGRISRKVVLQ